MKKLLIIRLLLIQLPLLAQQQQAFMFHYTLENGLAANTVYRIIQDHNGYIWMGTNAGVSCFNGHEFKNYDRQDGLVDDEIVGLAEDSKGRIWFLGITGRVCYFENGSIVSPYRNKLLAELSSGSAMLEMFEDKHHNLWFQSQHEILKLTENGVVKYKADEYPPVSFLYEYGDTLWLMSHKDALLYAYTDKTTLTIPVKHPYTGRGAFYRQTDGSVWYASQQKLIHLYGSNIKHEIPIPMNESIWLHDLLIEPDYSYWLSTSSGLYHQKNGKQAENLLPLETCGGLLKDNEGNIWVSTLKNGVFMIPAGRNEQHTQIPLPPGKWNMIAGFGQQWFVAGNTENKICYTTPGKPWKSIPVQTDIQQMYAGRNHLWLVRNLSLYLLNPASGQLAEVKCFNKNKVNPLSSVKYISFLEDKTIITTNYALYILSNKEENSNEKVVYAKRICSANTRIFSATAQQNQYYICNSGGLYKLSQSKITNIPTDHSIRGMGIPQMMFVGADTLLLATRGQGLLCLMKNGKQLQKIATEQGLRDAYCKKVIPWNNLLLLQTQGGISILDKGAREYTVIRNLHPGNFSAGASILDFSVNANQLCILTQQGIWCLQNNAPVLNRHKAPMLQIQANHAAETCEALEIKYGEPAMLQLQCIGFAYPADVHFRYRLQQGVWNEQSQAWLTLPLLGPGKYLLEVQARIGLGYWSHSETCTLTVIPLWWQNTWVQLFLLMVLLSASWYIMYRWFKGNRLKREKLHKLEQQMQDLEQQALLGLMNPHFIFNVMNAIQHFINSSKVSDANLYISGFARLIRKNLDLIKLKNISLEDELELLQEYLRFEEMRFGEKAKVSIWVEPEIDVFDNMVPVMMLQPFVENAIWHGVLTYTGKAEIVIKITRPHEKYLHVIISDTGKGMPAAMLGNAADFSGEKNHGIAITIERLKLLSRKAQIPFYLHFSRAIPEQDKGTCVEMHLPLVSYLYQDAAE